MDAIVVPEVENYAEAQTTPPSDALRALARETEETFESHSMMVGALEGRILEFLVFMMAPRRVLEIGTFTGYSALSMAPMMPDGGRIITCDIAEEHVAFARRHLAASGYGDRVEIRVGPALDTIAALNERFDLVFIDADKPNYIAYYEAVLPLLAENGVIAVDNTLWSGRVVDDVDDSANTLAIRAFNDHVRDDDRTVCVVLTVRDGLTLIRRARG